MNHRTLPTSPTRASVSRPTSLLILAGAWLLAGTARADGPPKAPPALPVLNLADGGVVPGTLAEFSTASVVRWKSKVFATPLEFPVGGIRSIRFPVPEKSPRPTGSFGFELTGGDLLFGSIESLDDKVAVLDVARLGKLTVERPRIQRVFRWRDGADLVYNGPNGLTGWREIAPAKKRADQAGAMMPGMIIVNGAAGAQPLPKSPKTIAPPAPAWSEDGGQLQSNKDGAAIQGDVGLPARASVELELSWKTTPDFLLAIGVSDDEKSPARAFRFEVWDGQLVVLCESDREGDVVPIQKIGEGPGRAQLQLFLDQEQGKLLVFSNGGELLAELKVGGRTGPALPGVRLVNLRGDVRLERLRVGRWDGETPRPLEADASRVQLTDMSISRGQVERLDPATREFVVRGESGEARIAEDKVSNIFFARPEDNAPRTVRVIYQDGTRVGGNWVNVLGASLVLESPGVAGALQVPIDGLRSLDVLKPDPKSRDKDAVLGTLEMEGVSLLGCLVDSGERPGNGGLVWQPLSGDKASPIRPGASGRIIYRTPPPVAKPAQATRTPAAQQNVVAGFFNALQTTSSRGNAGATSTAHRSLYLRTGDIVPAEIVTIDEQGVKFRTEFSDNGFVPHASIKAVEMAPEAGAAIRINKAKFERLLTLPRMQRDSPPTHLIRSKNGDILRGRVIAMDDKSIRVEVRLEEKVIDRDRVSRIIWLHADETDPSKKAPEPPEKAATGRVQAVRSDGIRLTFTPEWFADGVLSGKSEALGACKVRIQDLDQLLIGGFVEKEAVQLAYQNWKLQNAPDPKAMQLDDDGTPNGGDDGTESALVGKPAPDFELELMGAGGKKFHLADNKGKVIVLDFWATWCGPCIQAMPQIEKVTHEFADKGVQLIAVNLQETPAKIAAMLERQKLSPTVALDRDGVVAERYAANAIPQTVVIDREGKVTRLFIGGGPKLGDQLREALQAALTMPDKP